MFNLEFETMMGYIHPMMSELYPIARLLAAVPLVYWLIAKITQIRRGKEEIEGFILKLLSLTLFIFFWQPIFVSVFYFSDAMEARVLELNITDAIPTHLQGSVDTTDLQEILSNKESVLERKVNDGTYDQQNEEMAKELEEVGDGILEKWSLMLKNNLSNAKDYWIPTSPFESLIHSLSVLVRDFMLMVRFVCSIMLYLTIPFFIVFSYVPVLGDQDDAKGLNAFSRRIINTCIHMAYWPVLYALLDMLFVVIYYLLVGAQYMSGMHGYMVFYLVYIVMYIGLPMLMMRGDSYGILQSSISALSTTAMIGSGSLGSVGRGGAKAMSNFRSVK